MKKIVGLETATNSVSLNAKVSPELLAKVKKVKMLAKKNGFNYNVSSVVETLLAKEIDKVLKELESQAK